MRYAYDAEDIRFINASQMFGGRVGRSNPVSGNRRVDVKSRPLLLDPRGGRGDGRIIGDVERNKAGAQSMRSVLAALAIARADVDRVPRASRRAVSNPRPLFAPVMSIVFITCPRIS